MPRQILETPSLSDGIFLSSTFPKLHFLLKPTESGLTLGRSSPLGDTADSHGKLKLGSSATFPAGLKQELLFWEAAGQLPKNLKVAHQHLLETHA